MKCGLAKIGGKNIPCDCQDCGIWDRKKEQCGVLSYMQAYFAMGLATLKMTEVIEGYERKLEEED